MASIQQRKMKEMRERRAAKEEERPDIEKTEKGAPKEPEESKKPEQAEAKKEEPKKEPQAPEISDEKKVWSELSNKLAEGESITIPGQGDAQNLATAIKQLLVGQANDAAGRDKYDIDDVKVNPAYRDGGTAEFTIGRRGTEFKIEAVSNNRELSIKGMQGPEDDLMVYKNSAPVIRAWKELQQKLADSPEGVHVQNVKTLIGEYNAAYSGDTFHQGVHVPFKAEMVDHDGDGVLEKKETTSLGYITVESILVPGKAPLIISMKGLDDRNKIEAGSGVKVDVPKVKTQEQEATPAENKPEVEGEPKATEAAAKAEAPASEDSAPEQDAQESQVAQPEPDIYEPPQVTGGVFEDDGQGVKNSGPQVVALQQVLMQDVECNATLTTGGIKADDGMEGWRTRYAAEYAVSQYDIKVPEGQSAAHYLANNPDVLKDLEDAIQIRNMEQNALMELPAEAPRETQQVAYIDHEKFESYYNAAAKIDAKVLAGNFNAQGQAVSPDNTFNNDHSGLQSNPTMTA